MLLLGFFSYCFESFGNGAKYSELKSLVKMVVQCKWGAFINRDRNANGFILLLVLVLLGLP